MNFGFCCYIRVRIKGSQFTFLMIVSYDEMDSTKQSP